MLLRFLFVLFFLCEAPVALFASAKVLMFEECYIIMELLSFSEHSFECFQEFFSPGSRRHLQGTQFVPPGGLSEHNEHLKARAVSYSPVKQNEHVCTILTIKH